MFFRDLLRGIIHRFLGKVFEQRDIDPALAGFVVEQFAFDAATCSKVGIAPDQDRARIGATNSGIKHHAADRIRRDLIPGILQLGINVCLTVDV